MFFRYLLSALATGAIVVVAQPSMYAVDLRGSVLSVRGAPVRGAVVSAHRTVEDAKGVRIESLTALTEASGGFAFANLANAKWDLCVACPGQLYLNPCLWSSSALKADLTSKSVSDFRIVLAEGKKLKIRVSDDDRVLAPADRPGEGTSVLPEIWTKANVARPAYLVSASPKWREFEIIVPEGEDLKMSVSGPEIDAEDDKQQKLGADSALAFRVDRGDTEKSIEIKVKKKKKP